MCTDINEATANDAIKCGKIVNAEDVQRIVRNKTPVCGQCLPIFNVKAQIYKEQGIIPVDISDEQKRASLEALAARYAEESQGLERTAIPMYKRFVCNRAAGLHP
jgi:hypothetical protein